MAKAIIIKTHKNRQLRDFLIFRAKLQGRGEPEISPALTGGLSGPQNWLSCNGSGPIIFVSDVRIKVLIACHHRCAAAAASCHPLMSAAWRF